MKKIITGLVFAIGVMACTSTPTLQSYIVAKKENPNFISIDMPSSVLNIKSAELTEDQSKAFKTVRKLNVLAFKKTENNSDEYVIEKSALNVILDNPKFNELMKLNTPYGKATISYIGDDDSIDEVIVFGDNKEKGFILLRVLGKDIQTMDVGTIINGLKDSNYNLEDLEPLQALF